MLNRDILILEHILEYCSSLVTFRKRFGNTIEKFLSDVPYQMACNMAILQIGELSTKLSDNIKKEIPDIPWHQIKGLRNYLAHDYGSIRLEDMWDTIINDIPLLEKAIRSNLSEIYRYKTVTEAELKLLQDSDFKFSSKKKDGLIIIKYYFDDENKINNLLNQKPPTMKR